MQHHPVNVDLPLTLRVDASRQVLEVWEYGLLQATYPVSTSRFGLGSEPGSYKTPLGRFSIREKIGEGAPVGAVFKGRIFTGQIAEQGGEEDHILTRILWLHGLDPENANTHDRYIYIHGTNQESLLGTPASHGCIRMHHDDLITLFDRVPSGTPLEIVA